MRHSTVGGMCYKQVSAAVWHTMLLRNNGCAAACGNNCSGECDIPALEPGLRYIADSLSLRRDLVVQLDFVCEDDAITGMLLLGRQRSLTHELLQI